MTMGFLTNSTCASHSERSSVYSFQAAVLFALIRRFTLNDVVTEEARDGLRLRRDCPERRSSVTSSLMLDATLPSAKYLLSIDLDAPHDVNRTFSSLFKRRY